MTSRVVSYALQARLLNLCSSLLYLSGDAVHAIECLRNSLIASKNVLILNNIHFTHDYSDSDNNSTDNNNLWIPYDSNNTNNSTSSSSSNNKVEEEEGLIKDTEIKLASLLTDMDETDEAEKLLKSVLKKDGRNLYALVHLSELYIHQSKFEQAMSLLSDAKYYSYNQYDTIIDIRKQSSTNLDTFNQLFECPTVQNNNNRNELFQVSSFKRRSKNEIKDIHFYKKYIQDKLTLHLHKSMISSIFSLMSAAMFRLHPAEPEHALKYIHEGLEMHPDSVYMLLCQGNY